MHSSVISELHLILDTYFPDAQLNLILKQCIEEKKTENSKWSEITRYTHLMLGGTSPVIDRFAALTEMVILSGDIMDDLQDQDQPNKAWMNHPPETAMNAVVSFLVAFYGEIGELTSGLNGLKANAAAEISRMIANSITGQHRDTSRSVMTEADYITMIEEKSGSLMRFACYMGYALLPDLDEGVMDQMNELASCIGILAQIENDLRDIRRDDWKNDLMQKKRTLPSLFMLKDSAVEFPLLIQFYAGEVSVEEFLLRIQDTLQYVDHSGCLEYTRIIQALFIEKAEELYTSLPAISPWKEEFRQITFGQRRVGE